MMDDLADLANYPAIGWDFDQTLIDNPNAPRFWGLIHRHEHIRHYIITFRSHGLEASVFRELAQYPGAPDPTAFTEVINIGNAYWTADRRARLTRDLRQLAGLSSLPLSTAELFYQRWKALVCQQHGIPVLVDDNVEHTLPGCEHYGVRLFHSLSLAWVR